VKVDIKRFNLFLGRDNGIPRFELPLRWSNGISGLIKIRHGFWIAIIN
jgi:hypothetical protein